MNLSELSPFPTYVTWNGELIKLRPFDLRAITWAERFFVGGFEGMNKILSKLDDENLLNNTLIDIVYHLGAAGFEKHGIKSAVDLKLAINEKGKEALTIEYAIQQAILYKFDQHDKTKLDLIDKKIDEAQQLSDEITRENISEIITDFFKAVEEVLKNSFPQKKVEPEQTGGAIFQFLKKREEELKKEEQEETNWEYIYIDFYRDGGMSLDQFMSLTMKQIDSLYPELIFKQSVEFAQSAMLNGKKLQQKPRRKRAS